MRLHLLLLFFIFTSILPAQETMKYNKLNPLEQQVILFKTTEKPWSGKYVNHKEDGIYTCKQCDAPLYRFADKFDAHCGWPSFDDEIPGAVKRIPDADGVRTEIVCANCGGHLGYIFSGEEFTPKNIRHCVNSVSLNFIPNETTPATEQAIFASGCFWGTEYYFQKAPGVISTTAGYIGGHQDSPTYKQVCAGRTGHKEAVEVIYDPAKTSYEVLARLYFETHDFTQTNGQGPDIGEQYQSFIFYTNEEQRKIAVELINLLREKGYDVATRLEPSDTFWRAEDYHQDYYENNGKQPYCHFKRNVF